MTTLAFDPQGIDVVYEGTEFRLERALVEEATGKAYFEVTDHEVLRLIEPSPATGGTPRRIGDIVE